MEDDFFFPFWRASHVQSELSWCDGAKIVFGRQFASHGKFRYTLTTSETSDGGDLLSLNRADIEIKIAYSDS